MSSLRVLHLTIDLLQKLETLSFFLTPLLHRIADFWSCASETAFSNCFPIFPHLRVGICGPGAPPLIMDLRYGSPCRTPGLPFRVRFVFDVSVWMRAPCACALISDFLTLTGCCTVGDSAVAVVRIVVVQGTVSIDVANVVGVPGISTPQPPPAGGPHTARTQVVSYSSEYLF